jgi:guanylate kinase
VSETFNSIDRAAHGDGKLVLTFDPCDGSYPAKPLVGGSSIDVSQTPRGLDGSPPEVVVVAGGSGSGKTTLTRKLLDKYPDTFHLVPRVTTRPKRSKDEAEHNTHRFMSEDEFTRHEHLLLGVTRPYGFRYGFLLEDLRDAQMSKKVWVTHTLVQYSDLKALWPEMRVTVVGVFRVASLAADATDTLLLLGKEARDRIAKRDPTISAGELEARVEKTRNDAQFVAGIADYRIFNLTGGDSSAIFSEFERACLFGRK